MKLKLPIFYKPEGWQQIEAMGKEIPLKDCSIRTVTFYNADKVIIEPMCNDDVEYCGITVDGQSYDCPLSAVKLGEYVDAASQNELLFEFKN